MNTMKTILQLSMGLLALRSNQVRSLSTSVDKISLNYIGGIKELFEGSNPPKTLLLDMVRWCKNRIYSFHLNIYIFVCLLVNIEFGLS